jgi:hypothetical protein
LIFLVADQLGLTTTNKVMRLLENSSSGTPGIIAYLSNESNDSYFQFSTEKKNVFIEKKEFLKKFKSVKIW